MRFFLIFFLLAALPFSATADEREARVAVAKEYVDMALADFDMDGLVATMWAPVVAQVEASGVAVTDDQRKAIDALYKETFVVPMAALMQEQSGLMADMMTLEEITALRDFYATPAGRSVMAKLPQLSQAQQPGLMQLINEKMPALMPQVLDIVNAAP
jgi:hypothetical protein